MVLKPLLQRPDTRLCYHPERVGRSNQEDRHYEQSNYGNDQVGWGLGRRQPLGPLTAIMPAMQDNLSGQVRTISAKPTPWHNQNDTPVKSSYFGIVDTAGLPKNDFTFTKVNGYQLRNINGSSLTTLDWDNPELANRVMDEGRIPVHCLLQCPQCGN